eukprot:gnl/Chilomastix_cuspidata/4773.p1 GENE.gnl/Chilomastix_cuspidata/4773~~gnl/Chilomastix_cuspidata/4773.p1  ORF type:complete len:512 (+),score=264.00 gnl/Chilomastix_cuspidata/4773:317-1852(+)
MGCSLSLRSRRSGRDVDAASEDPKDSASGPKASAVRANSTRGLARLSAFGAAGGLAGAPLGMRASAIQQLLQGSDSFLERTERDLQRRSEKRRLTQRQRERAAWREQLLGDEPAINPVSRGLSRGLDAFEEWDALRKEKLSRLQARKERQFRAANPGRPQINPNSARLAARWKENPRNSRSASFVTATRDESPPRSPPLPDRRIQEAAEKLYTRALEKRMRRAEPRVKEYPFAPNRATPPPVLTWQGSAARDGAAAPAYEHLLDFGRRKEQRLQALRDERAAFEASEELHRPRVNRRSAQLADARIQRYHAGETLEERLTRERRTLSPQVAHDVAAIEGELTFAPQINRLSQALDASLVETLVGESGARLSPLQRVGVIFHRHSESERRIAREQSLREGEILSECTFSPSISLQRPPAATVTHPEAVPEAVPEAAPDVTPKAAPAAGARVDPALVAEWIRSGRFEPVRGAGAEPGELVVRELQLSDVSSAEASESSSSADDMPRGGGGDGD